MTTMKTRTCKTTKVPRNKAIHQIRQTTARTKEKVQGKEERKCLLQFWNVNVSSKGTETIGPGTSTSRQQVMGRHSHRLNVERRIRVHQQ
jgi:hypothetical protein